MKIIKCKKCNSNLRIPTNKHIKFVCPHCNENYEIVNGEIIEKKNINSKKWWNIVKILMIIILIINIVVFIIEPPESEDIIDNIIGTLTEELVIFSIGFIFIKKYDENGNVIKRFRPGVISILIILQAFLVLFFTFISFYMNKFEVKENDWYIIVVICFLLLLYLGIWKMKRWIFVVYLFFTVFGYFLFYDQLADLKEYYIPFMLPLILAGFYHWKKFN